jgi:hypothetical protein
MSASLPQGNPATDKTCTCDFANLSRGKSHVLSRNSQKPRVNCLLGIVASGIQTADFKQLKV